MRRIQIDLNPQQEALIDELLTTGLFGADQKEVAQRLLDRELMNYAPPLETPDWWQKKPQEED